MIFKKTIEKVSWLEQSRELLKAACSPQGIKASLTDKDNYGAIFTRDAVMAGIAGVLLKDNVIIEGFKNTLFSLKKIQGKQGQIASNFTVKDGQISKTSFGTLSPKIDSCTWYLVGIGILIKENLIEKEAFEESVARTINLLEGLEYNGKNLMYIPKGGNWADEYIYEGYVLYDQVLRVWGMTLLAKSYDNKEWADKAQFVISSIEKKYKNKESQYYNSSFSPGGIFKKFDLAAHTLAGMIFEKDNQFFDKSLDWIFEEFIKNKKLPTAFHPVISEADSEWKTLRNYHLFDFKNEPHHYHNGGIWWIWLGWLSITLSLWKKEAALNQLIETAFNYLKNSEQFDFDEYLSADELIPNGTKKLCYTATGIIFLSLAKKSFDFSILDTSTVPLINEPFLLKEEYFDLSSEIIKKLRHSSLLSRRKLVIGICGESGSGKSVTAKCLQIELKKQNIDSIILHQDSYYKLPPKENHEKRKSDLSWVGANEVQMDLLQSHIEQFKSKEEKITVPVLDYEKNLFVEYDTNIQDKPVLIVEGVYTFLLEDLDYKVFMERTYKETLEKRRNRTREIYDPFVECVLKIEQSLVLPLKKLANVSITNNYSIR